MQKEPAPQSPTYQHLLGNKARNKKGLHTTSGLMQWRAIVKVQGSTFLATKPFLFAFFII
jgi:hypothetical protein